LQLRAPDLEITVECSYFEIYSEKVFDLLNPAKSGKDAKALKVRESPVLGPYVQGLKPFAVSSFVEVDHLLEQGQRSRHVAGTAMNATSSRSHAIFALTVTQAFVSDDGTKDDDMEKSSKINLVDLAGSERQAKTMATGARLSEGSAINLSLSSLGMVINALVKASGEGGKAKSHIPYAPHSHRSTTTSLLPHCLRTLRISTRPLERLRVPAHEHCVSMGVCVCVCVCVIATGTEIRY
jgi:kinesin family protein 1